MKLGSDFGGATGSPIINCVRFIRLGCVDSNFDNNGAIINFLALKGGNSLVLFFFITNINKTITLALPWVTPTPANDTSRDNTDTSFGEEDAKGVIINTETEISNEEHCFRGLAKRGFESGAGNARGPGPLGARLLGGWGAFSDNRDLSVRVGVAGGIRLDNRTGVVGLAR